MKHFFLFCTVASLFLFGCADANDPIQSKLEIEKQYQLDGDPVSISISDKHVVAAQEELGFAVFNRESGALVESVQEMESGGLTQVYDQTSKVVMIDELENFVVFNRTNTDQFTFYHAGDDSIRWIHPSIVGNTNRVIQMHLEYVGENMSNGFPYNVEGSYLHYNYTAEDSPEQGYYIRFPRFYIPAEENAFGNMSISYSTRVETDNIEDYIVEENILYYTDEHFGVRIANIVAEDFVDEIARVNTPGTPLDIIKKGNYIYVADKYAGLQVIDVTDIHNPILIPNQSFDTSGYFRSLDIDGNLLAILSSGSGLYLFDIANPAVPKFIEHLGDDEIGYSNQVKFFNGKIYVASRDKGVLEIKIN